MALVAIVPLRAADNVVRCGVVARLENERSKADAHVEGRGERSAILAVLPLKAAPANARVIIARWEDSRTMFIPRLRDSPK